MKRKDLKDSEMEKERRCEEIEIEVRKGAKIEERRNVGELCSSRTAKINTTFSKH